MRWHNKKGSGFMKKLRLTDDAAKNISMMLPYLSEEAREKVSLVIFGSYLMMPKEKVDCVKEKS